MIEEAPILTVKALRKGFGEHAVLRGVDLLVPRGGIVSILGRSGAGKSVFLKCLAGLMKPDGGEIRFENGPGASASSRTSSPRTSDQRCSYLFQANALFDSLTAFENVALPLEQTTRLRPEEIRREVTAALKNLGLEKFADHFPAQLSGGMQKRLGLARALVTRPTLVLFDEPTAGLDPVARNGVFLMIRQYRDEFDFTAVVVTHDVPQALAVSDQVALLEEGRTYFQGTPAAFAAADDSVLRSFADNEEPLQPRMDPPSSGNRRTTARQATKERE